MNRHFESKLFNRAQRAGLFPLLRKIRGAAKREIPRWIRAGCPSPAPHLVKMAIVKSYITGSGAKLFVETGTFTGATLDVIARIPGVVCHSIEIDPNYHERARQVLAGRDNIHLILGDSGAELAKLLERIDEPAVFWLDAHYSGGLTGRGALDTPISAELDAILAHPIKRHIVLIDDARDFQGEDGYPFLSELLAAFDQHGEYRAEVSADIVRITPR